MRRLLDGDWTDDSIKGVRIEQRGWIVVVTLDSRESRNALTTGAFAELMRRWREFDVDPAVRAIVITGAEDPEQPPERQSFSSGADLREQPADRNLPALYEELSSLAAFEPRTPSIAAVNGYCIGGGLTLMLATDLRVASPWASFGLPEVARGIIPANGGVRRLFTELPRAIAMELLLGPHRISAERACQVGLVNAVVDHSDVLDTALEWARYMSGLPHASVRAVFDLAAKVSRLSAAEAARLESAVLAELQGSVAST